ncbi:hypothetical protein Tco_1532147 [Tanacetum coccineum]
MVYVHSATDVASHLVAYTRERKGGYSRPSAAESINKAIQIQKRSEKPLSPLSKGSGAPGGGRTTPKKEARSSHSFHQKFESARIVLDERITEYAHEVRAIGYDSKLLVGENHRDRLRWNEIDLLRTGLTDRDLDLLLLSEHSDRRDLEVSLLFGTLLWCFNGDLDLLWFLLISKDPLEELLLALLGGYLPWELLNLFAGIYHRLDLWGQSCLHAPSTGCGLDVCAIRTSYVNRQCTSSDEDNALPLARYCTLTLEETCCSLPPKETGCFLPPEESGCSLPPEETGCSLPREETCWSLPFKETSCSLPPEETGCSLPPKETCWSLHPEETGCSLPLEETCWSLPPEETGCSLHPEETGCSIPHEETCWSLPIEETRCSLPYEETCWSLPPKETGCSLPPKETCWSLPPKETSCSYLLRRLYSLVISSGPEVAFVTSAIPVDHSNMEWFCLNIRS